MSGRGEPDVMLIADDFGLGRQHDEVILDLLAERRISGTSVMIDGDIAPPDLERLRRLRQEGALVGLHLNLTHAFAGSARHAPLGDLLRLCLTGNPPGWAEQEFDRQAKAFVQAFGTVPDYYDGHQHCHCLPGLAAFAATLPRRETCWMRVPLPARLSGFVMNLRAGGPKVLSIALFAFLARRTFRRSGWATNRDFSGFLHLDRPESVARWLPRLLRDAPEDCLVMVHPGSAADPSQCDGHAPSARAEEAMLLRRRA